DVLRVGGGTTRRRQPGKRGALSLAVRQISRRGRRTGPCARLGRRRRHKGAHREGLGRLLRTGVAADAARLEEPGMIPTFSLSDPLPAAKSTTVLEASAGTGKTFTLAGLVTRYVAEGAATLDQMLLITFGRAASQELRDRVRSQLVDSAANEEQPDRRRRLRDALAGFDAAT